MRTEKARIQSSVCKPRRHHPSAFARVHVLDHAAGAADFLAIARTPRLKINPTAGVEMQKIAAEINNTPKDMIARAPNASPQSAIKRSTSR